jgi:hypothetical protein
MAAERYVRPPIVASEPRSRRAGRWRFRLVVGLVLLIRSIVGGGEGNPGVLGPQRIRISTVATVPPPSR